MSHGIICHDSIVSILVVLITAKIQINLGEEIMNVSIETLAKEFSQSLKSALSSEEMNDLVKKNQSEKIPGICHSHDYCDANMVLHKVFMKHGMDIADEGGRERWGEMWDSAWNLAKSNDFWSHH